MYNYPVVTPPLPVKNPLIIPPLPTKNPIVAPPLPIKSPVIAPPPMVQETSCKPYPLEQTNPNFIEYYIQLYNIAKETGYTNDLQTFRESLGSIFQALEELSKMEIYNGQTVITPLPEFSQLLRTSNKIVRDDILVEPIPYYETTNNAGGYTAIIG